MEGEMNTAEAVKLLKEFNKWRRGKGKKYSQPGVPFDCAKVGQAIDFAVTHLSKRMDRDDFIVMSSMVEKWASYTKSVKCPMADNEKKALRSMRRVVKFLVKKNG